jgi:hypothetical protein
MIVAPVEPEFPDDPALDEPLLIVACVEVVPEFTAEPDLLPVWPPFGGTLDFDVCGVVLPEDDGFADCLASPLTAREPS